MKKVLLFLVAFIMGATLVQIPELFQLYDEHVLHTYQKKLCPDRNTCHFGTFYDPYVKDHPTLHEISDYFILGEGPLYWILSGRCSHKPFVNVDAAGKQSGKITNREYFW